MIVWKDAVTVIFLNKEEGDFWLMSMTAWKYLVAETHDVVSRHSVVLIRMEEESQRR